MPGGQGRLAPLLRDRRHLAAHEGAWRPLCPAPVGETEAPQNPVAIGLRSRSSLRYQQAEKKWGRLLGKPPRNLLTPPGKNERRQTVAPRRSTAKIRLMMASTSRMWTHAPIVEPETRPSTHRTSRITVMVQSMLYLLCRKGRSRTVGKRASRQRTTRAGARPGRQRSHRNILAAHTGVHATFWLPCCGDRCALRWPRERSPRWRAPLWTIGISRQTILPLALLPFLPASIAAKQALFLGCAFANAALGVAGNNAWTSWMGDLVPRAVRGRYF